MPRPAAPSRLRSQQLSFLAPERPTVARVMKRALQLSRVVPARSTWRRTDGVVPMNRDDALAWSRSNSPEVLGESGVEFKLGVAGEDGQIAAACFGARSAELGPDAVEVTPVAPRANEAPFQAALRAGALAAVAMGFDRVAYYRPVGDDPGDPFEGFAPLAARAFRSKAGGGLPWKLEATDYFAPWLRSHDPARYLALKADEIRAAQVAAILAWEDAEQELLERTNYEPTDAQYVALGHRFGFDYFDDWRPVEMTREDAYQHLEFDAVFERYVLAAASQRRALRVRPLPFAEANATVMGWHSHLKRPMRGHLFSLGVYAREVPGVYPEHLRAVAVVSLPRSQALMLQGAVVEVVRVAVASGLPPLAGVDPRHRGSEASFVLRHVVEAAVALGYDRVVSSTLLGEAGAGYRAAGWLPVAVSLGGEWSREGREREAAEQPGVKVRWEAGPGASEPVALPDAGTVDELVRDAHALAVADPDAMPLGGPREAPARKPRTHAVAAPSLPKMNRAAPPWKPAQGPRRGVPSW